MAIISFMAFISLSSVGGCIDSMHQPLILQLMVVTPEDVSKVLYVTMAAQHHLELLVTK